MHGHQAIVFLHLHISTVDREVHHSKHKTTPFLFEAGRPGGGGGGGGRVRAHTYTATRDVSRKSGRGVFQRKILRATPTHDSAHAQTVKQNAQNVPSSSRMFTIFVLL